MDKMFGSVSELKVIITLQVSVFLADGGVRGSTVLLQ